LLLVSNAISENLIPAFGLLLVSNAISENLIPAFGLLLVSNAISENLIPAFGLESLLLSFEQMTKVICKGVQGEHPAARSPFLRVSTKW